MLFLTASIRYSTPNTSGGDRKQETSRDLAGGVRSTDSERLGPVTSYTSAPASGRAHVCVRDRRSLLWRSSIMQQTPLVGHVTNGVAMQQQHGVANGALVSGPMRFQTILSVSRSS